VRDRLLCRIGGVPRLWAFVLSLFSLILMSCSSSSGSAVDVTVDYQDIAEPGFIDQTVLLEHGSGSDVVPTIRYTPLDADGEAVPGVEVSTVYGSDEGRLVVGTGGEIDILVFEGERASEVVGAEGAAINVIELGTSTAPWLTQPQAVRGGVEVSKFEAFEEVMLSNEDAADVSVRVVCILWNFPVPGQAQQAEQVDTVVDEVRVPAGETVVARVSEEFADRTDALGFGCDSLKAHPTIGS